MGTQYYAKTLDWYKKKALNAKVDQEEMMLTSTGPAAEDKCGDVSPLVSSNEGNECHKVTCM